MYSHNAMAQVIKRDTTPISAAIDLKPGMVQKMKEASGEGQSGTKNPLDRLVVIIEKALALGRPKEEAFAPIYFLISHFNLTSPAEPVSFATVNNQFGRIASEFGQLMQVVGEAHADTRISPNELCEIVTAINHIRLNLDLYESQVRTMVVA